MSRSGPRGSSLATFTKCLAVLGVVLLVVAVFRQEPAPPEPKQDSAISVRAAAPMPASRPVSLAIPALGIDAPVVQLGVREDKGLETPSDPASAGWYRGSSAPGAAGATVIAGHVTWSQKPAVFFELGKLKPGERVLIKRTDGEVAVFKITKIEKYAKVDFPTARIYRPGIKPALRLITCGGRFDAANDTYTDNVVAFGTLVGHRAGLKHP